MNAPEQVELFPLRRTSRSRNLPEGAVFAWRAPGVNGLEAFVYLPHSRPRPKRVLVTVHGITRNALEHALSFAELAEAGEFAVVAPLFERKAVGRYQTLARGRRRMAADNAFDAMLDALAGATGLDLDKLSLFGFSGGGQFAHRYAMTHPARVARLVIGAAGWYTMPDPLAAWPYGLADPPAEMPAPALDAFLRIPVRVIVGDGDDQRDAALNQAARIDRGQGLTRIDRGRAWVDALRAAAARAGLPPRAGFELLPGATHNFADAMHRHGLGPAVVRFLFGGNGAHGPAESARPGTNEESDDNHDADDAA